MATVSNPFVFPAKLAFLRFRKLVTISECQNASDSWTSTGSPASFPSPRSGASSATLWPSLSPCNGVEKNALWSLRTSFPHLLRQTAASGPRPVLWRQARLSRFSGPQGLLLSVWRRETRTVGLARRQSVVHQTVCLLRGPALSCDHGHGSGRGLVPRLAFRQRTRQAVHARATPARGSSCSAGDRHRRNRYRQGAPVPHRGQRLGAWLPHLVWGPGSLRGEPRRVLRLAESEEMRPNPPGGHGYVEGVPQLHAQGGQRPAGDDPVRQVPYPDSPGRSHGQGSQARIRTLVGQRPAVHQGAAVHAVVALGQPHGRRAHGSETAVQGQHAAEQGLPAQGVLRATVGLPEPAVGLAFLRPVAERSAVATAGTVRALCPVGGRPLGRHRLLLPRREQSAAGFRGGSEQQDPNHSAASLRLPG